MKKEFFVMAYEKPQVEIIDVEVEKGFATSPGDGELEGTGDEEW